MYKNKKFKVGIILVAVVIMLTIICGVVAAEEQVELETGTIIYVETINDLKPGDLKKGDNVELITTEDVKASGKVVIKEGETVSGRVTDVQAKGSLGKADKLTLEINSVRAVDGTIISLSGKRNIEGDDKQTEAVGGGLFLCAPLLLMEGEEAMIPANTKIEAKVTSSYTINVD